MITTLSPNELIRGEYGNDFSRKEKGESERRRRKNDRSIQPASRQGRLTSNCETKNKGNGGPLFSKIAEGRGD